MEIDLEPHEYRRNDEPAREPILGPNAPYFAIMFVLAIPTGYVANIVVEAILAPLW